MRPDAGYRLWSWYGRSGMWVHIADGTEAEMFEQAEARQRTAAIMSQTGTAFVVLPRDAPPLRNPSWLDQQTD